MPGVPALLTCGEGLLERRPSGEGLRECLPGSGEGLRECLPGSGEGLREPWRRGAGERLREPRRRGAGEGLRDACGLSVWERGVLERPGLLGCGARGAWPAVDLWGGRLRWGW
jgi:hypothetical protein